MPTPNGKKQALMFPAWMHEGLIAAMDAPGEWHLQLRDQDKAELERIRRTWKDLIRVIPLSAGLGRLAWGVEEGAFRMRIDREGDESPWWELRVKWQRHFNMEEIERLI